MVVFNTIITYSEDAGVVVLSWKYSAYSFIGLLHLCCVIYKIFSNNFEFFRYKLAIHG